MEAASRGARKAGGLGPEHPDLIHNAAIPEQALQIIQGHGALYVHWQARYPGSG